MADPDFVWMSRRFCGRRLRLRSARPSTCEGRCPELVFTGSSKSEAVELLEGVSSWSGVCPRHMPHATLSGHRGPVGIVCVVVWTHSRLGVSEWIMDLAVLWRA